ncbi:hypothetical protein [Rhodoplanes sp. SY1]|uniref:hypothetical protein n=1 Tax=Rhodoplanes sp. SY1 TaxID=3166646 RepID=UPI0038B47AA9
MGRKAREELVAGGYLEGIPENLHPFFSVVPVLETENLDDYAILLHQAIASLQPSRLEEWVFLKEHADLTWEIVRLQNIKTSMLNVALYEVASDVSHSLDGRISRHCNTVNISADVLKERPGWFRETMAEHGLSPHHVLSQAHIRLAPELERLERLIAIKERTRQAGLETFYQVREHYASIQRQRESSAAEQHRLPPPAREAEGGAEAGEAA